MSRSKILFQLTGSIAGFKACDLISKLVQRGHEVQTVASQDALKFVGEATLEGLTGRPALKSLFQPGSHMEHIYLADWCDLAILCPATARTINGLAAGVGEELIGALFLAFDRSKPYVVVPAMNTRMWEHPSVTSSIQRLKEWGVHVLDTQEGRLACGAHGWGKMLEPQTILEELDARLSPRQGKRILITAGGTTEPIDAVRSLSNFSTGRTGAELADYFHRRGHEVTLLHAHRALNPATPVRLFPFNTRAELEALMKRLLADEPFHLVVHAAAVSDFEVERKEGKITSQNPLTLTLHPAPKILPQIKPASRNSQIKLVGFKLTTGLPPQAQKEESQKILLSGADWVVHNSLEEVGEREHRCTLYNTQGAISTCSSRLELAQTLERLMET